MKQYIVDAFTDKVFAGNPAAVCVLENWLSDEVMTSIAAENNLSETAFIIKAGEKYKLRWFTVSGEIDLCGHATLASAHVVLTYLEKAETVTFDTMSGDLTVTKQSGLYEMDFPAYDLKAVEVTEQMRAATGSLPEEAYIGRDLLLVFDDESTIKHMSCDLEKVKELDGLLLHVTSGGRNTDCVSRSFAPKCGISEDPVCGSGHCHIIPYWAEKLRKDKLLAYQASKRGGTLYCKMSGNRVILGGMAVTFSVGEIFI